MHNDEVSVCLSVHMPTFLAAKMLLLDFECLSVCLHITTQERLKRL
jgi:hypothetical protein